MSDTDPEIGARAARGPVPRWIKWLLGLSLAVNLLIIGLAGGAAWRFSKDGPPGPDRTGFAFVAALERSDRQGVLSDLRGRGRDEGRARREDMARMLELLRAPDFDVSELDSLLTEQLARGQSVRSGIKDAVVNAVAGMTAAERAAYADRLEERLRRGRDKGGKHR